MDIILFIYIFGGTFVYIFGGSVIFSYILYLYNFFNLDLALDLASDTVLDKITVIESVFTKKRKLT
jgi:hypothetical protein